MPFKGAGYFASGHVQSGFVGGIGGQTAVKVTREEYLGEKWKTV